MEIDELIDEEIGIPSQEFIYDDEVEEYEPEGLTKNTEPKPQNSHEGNL